MTNKELETRYTQMKSAWKNLVNANIKLSDENKILKEDKERLNNIISELEKTLLEWHEYWEDDDSYSWQYKDTYDYLQELKGI